MSGHSKWSTIKRQKGAKDIKKGAAFTKLSNAITISVREGGGVADPEHNFRLRLAVEKARAANMPKENIARAIERGAGGHGGQNFEQIVYEGFGPGGVAIMIETVTDNRQRTVSAIKNALDKSGGSLGGQGSVGYLFNRRAFLLIKSQGKAEDLAMKLIDMGVEDVEIIGDEIEVYAPPEKLFETKKMIESQGLMVESAELTEEPLSLVPVSGETAPRVERLLEALEDMDDVQKVYTNADFVKEDIVER